MKTTDLLIKLHSMNTEGASLADRETLVQEIAGRFQKMYTGLGLGAVVENNTKDALEGELVNQLLESEQEQLADYDFVVLWRYPNKRQAQQVLCSCSLKTIKAVESSLNKSRNHDKQKCTH